MDFGQRERDLDLTLLWAWKAEKTEQNATYCTLTYIIKTTKCFERYVPEVSFKERCCELRLLFLALCIASDSLG